MPDVESAAGDAQRKSDKLNFIPTKPAGEAELHVALIAN